MALQEENKQFKCVTSVLFITTILHNLLKLLKRTLD